MNRFPALAAACLSVAMALPGAARADEAPKLDLGMIPPGHVHMPEGPPKASVVLISDGGGWGEREEADAAALTEKGAAVIGIDFPAYIRALKADEGDCIYMISDVESLAQQVQRAGGAGSYSPPILAGKGEGGALALAMISQSPAATIGEAIAVDPAAGIPLEKVLCTPAEKVRKADRTLYGFVPGPLPAPVTVLFSAAAPQDGRAHATALANGRPDVELRAAAGPAADALSAILNDRVDAAGGSDDPLGLPISVLPAKPAMDTMAVIYSGDGGWRDIDKQVGGALQEKGIPVIGIDSLRYFWSQRKPQETAADLSRIIEAYRKQWNVRHVLLIGYSFGADIVPATYNLLSQQDRDRVAQITLMALSHQVDYEVSVEGWLGVAGGGAGDPLTDIASIEPALVQCIYGRDDEDGACPDLQGKGVELIGLDGGHHFDGDYAALADRILASLKRRLAGRGQ